MIPDQDTLDKAIAERVFEMISVLVASGKAKNLTDVIESIGMLRPNYYKIKNGINALKTVYIHRLFEIYDVSPNWLITGQGEMFVSHQRTMSKRIEHIEKILKIT